MNGRSTASFLALLTLLATAFAGCLEAPSFLTSTDAEVSAAENKDLAENAAAAWNPEAKLVGVSTFEASEAHAEEAMGMVEVDPTVGNGRALLWFYAYQTPDGKDARVFRVDADGRIQVENTSMVPVADVGTVDPIGSWGVDSEQAVQAARADERFEAALGMTNASMVAALGNHDGGNKWALVAISEEKIVFAAVDATTGELLMVEETSVSDLAMPEVPTYPGEFAAPFHFEGSGTVDGSHRVAEHPFTYTGAPQDAGLHVATTEWLPFESVRWTLLDPEGEEVFSEYARGYETMFEFTLEAQGEYVLLVEYRFLPMVPTPVGGVDYEFVLDAPATEHEDEE